MRGPATIVRLGRTPCLGRWHHQDPGHCPAPSWFTKQTEVLRWALQKPPPIGCAPSAPTPLSLGPWAGPFSYTTVLPSPPLGCPWPSSPPLGASWGCAQARTTHLFLTRLHDEANVHAPLPGSASHNTGLTSCRRLCSATQAFTVFYLIANSKNSKNK